MKKGAIMSKSPALGRQIKMFIIDRAKEYGGVKYFLEIMNIKNVKLETNEKKLYLNFLNEIKKSLEREAIDYLDDVGKILRGKIDYWTWGAEFAEITKLGYSDSVIKNLESQAILQLLIENNLESYQIFSLTTKLNSNFENFKTADSIEYLKFILSKPNLSKEYSFVLNDLNQEIYKSEFNRNAGQYNKVISVDLESDEVVFKFENLEHKKYPLGSFKALISKHKPKI